MPEQESNLPDFPVSFTLPVQWGEQDLFGHANNVIYFRWIESARVAYWVDSGLRDKMEPLNLGPILANVSCDFKRQIKFPDTVEIGARVKKMGNTSVTLEHHFYSHQNEGIAAIGTSVVVFFDYAKQQTLRISDEYREMFAAFEGREL